MKYTVTQKSGLQVEYAALDAVCLLMLLDDIMTCAPPHLTTHTCEPAAEPGSDTECQLNSSDALATPSQTCLQGSQQQQQQNAEPESSQPTGLYAAAQTDSTAATAAGCPAKPLSGADTASGDGHNAEDHDADVDSSSSSSRGGQHVSGDKLQCDAAAASEASYGSSEHPPSVRLQSNTTAAGGDSLLTAGAAAGLQQASGVMQQTHQQKQSEPSRVTQQTGSQQSELSKVSHQTGSQQSKPSQAIQQTWQDQSGHQAAILQAIQHWACRLEMSAAGKASKPRARRHLSRRQRAHVRHAMEQQNQIDDTAG